ncbi:hypothetical protein C2845_PM07G32670 [Panicum miliaceum]|uniref:Uncharacterized protein n=1 Tax=Panicum miliaceum TaxID=4540 RepID=A0A3L6SPF6_PANMI|nr:hypothetical protein C2845_PM07G32670 [Panicum miliaceum]
MSAATCLALAAPAFAPGAALSAAERRWGFGWRGSKPKRQRRSGSARLGWASAGNPAGGEMSREQQPPRRFIAIAFSSGCRSHSSVDVVDTSRHAGKKPHPQGIEFGVVPGSASARPAAAAGKGESLVARLLRGFKNLSQIFAVYDEDDDEEEWEMQQHQPPEQYPLPLPALDMRQFELAMAAQAAATTAGTSGPHRHHS